MDISKTDLYVKNFSRMIQCETVTCGREDGSKDKFYTFHALLRELFPSLSAAVEWEDFNGSLLLRWKGTDPGIAPVCFMNHMDVVPALGHWEHEPFSGEVADGILWGRGTLDNKGGLWAMLQAADELAAEGWTPSRDIYFESSCDEEFCSHGADLISRTLCDRGVRFEMVFDEGGMVMHDPIGGADGTFAMVGLGEKGCCELRFVARSNGGHASTPGKNTPLVRLGKFMAAVEKKDPFDRQLNPVIKTMFRSIASYMGLTGKILGHPDLYGGIIRAVMPSISPTAGAMLKTTLAFTMAQGSEATNVLPQEAWVIGNMRFSHHQGREASIDALRPIAKKYGIEIEVLSPGEESSLTSPDGSAFRLVSEAVSATLPEVDAAVPYVMTGASDSRFFDRVSDQCIRFLPFTINETQLASIHGLNEHIEIKCLEPAVSYYRYLLTHC